jgi:hypothetical protein
MTCHMYALVHLSLNMHIQADSLLTRRIPEKTLTKNDIDVYEKKAGS